MISVKEGMEITVDLKATRGADGATAVVDIVPAAAKTVAIAVANTPALKVTPRGGLNLPSKPKPEEQPKEVVTETKAAQLAKVEVADDKSPEDEQGPVDPEVQTGNAAEDEPAGDPAPELEPEPETLEPEPVRRNIFKNMRKPDNSASE